MFMSYEKLAQVDLVKYFQLCFQAVLKEYKLYIIFKCVCGVFKLLIHYPTYTVLT